MELEPHLKGGGQFGGFMEYELAPWDFAAGWLIVEEAGGKITTRGLCRCRFAANDGNVTTKSSCSANNIAA